MPVVLPADSILVSIRGRIYGQQTITTYPYIVQAATGQPDMLTAFGLWAAQMQGAGGLVTTYLATTGQNFTVTELWIQDIRPQRYAAFRYLVNETGELNTSSQTTNVAGVITRRGALANRSAIGSVHIPIPSDSAWIVAGRLTPGMQTQLDLHAASMTAIIEVGGLTLQPGLLNNASGLVSTPVTLAFPQETARVMRRRTVGLGI